MKTAENGTVVKTKTVGKGATTGDAATTQTGAANGAADLKAAAIALLSDGDDLLKVTEVKKGAGTSSSGHKGSGVKDSLFKVLEEAETKIKLKGL